MNHSLRLSSAFFLLVASASFVACDVVGDPTGSNTGAIQGSGAACVIDSDCPSTTEECEDNVCKLHGGDEDGAGGDDAAGHDAGDDNGVDAAGHDAGDDNGVDAAGHDAGDDNGAGGEAGDDNGGGGENDGPDDNGGADA